MARLPGGSDADATQGRYCAAKVDEYRRRQVTDDWVFLVYREWPVAHHYETAFGSTLVRGFLLETALVTDLAFTPSADLSIWAPVRVAFDRTEWCLPLLRM